VKVGQRLQAVGRLAAERARRLVQVSAGHYVGVPGQGVRGRQVTAGQADRAGFFAEHRHPRLPLGRLAAPLRDVRGHRQGGPPGQPFHLGVGLPGQLAKHQRLSAGRLAVVQRLEELRDQLRLRHRQGPVGEEPTDTRQPGAQRPGQAREVPRGHRAHRQGPGYLVGEGVVPAVGQVGPAAQPRGAVGVLAGHRAQRGELACRRP
jgi:hypothetical protein